MDRRDLLKIIAISPIARALKAGTVTAAPVATSVLESTAVGRKDFESTETKVFQFREGEIKVFEVPDCKSMTIYAEKENKSLIFFGAEKDPAIKLQPGRQFIARDVPAARLYAVGSHDDLMIVTWVCNANITKK